MMSSAKVLQLESNFFGIWKKMLIADFTTFSDQLEEGNDLKAFIAVTLALLSFDLTAIWINFWIVSSDLRFFNARM